MARAILLDANLLIGALDSEEGNVAHGKAKVRLEALLSDDDVRLAITPLIRYEVLRGAKRVSSSELDAILNDFQEFEITANDARLAAEIFRAAKASNAPLDKKQFDVFHCVCAALNNLEIESQDGDIPLIKKLLEARE